MQASMMMMMRRRPRLITRLIAAAKLVRKFSTPAAFLREAAEFRIYFGSAFAAGCSGAPPIAVHIKLSPVAHKARRFRHAVDLTLHGATYLMCCTFCKAFYGGVSSRHYSIDARSARSFDDGRDALPRFWRAEEGEEDDTHRGPSARRRHLPRAAIRRIGYNIL